MDVERIIDEIEQLQEMFEAPDIRPLFHRRNMGRAYPYPHADH
jgi:hypothetical protein